uniref:NADH-ubiquinone oxidoreductase chain 2 n=1 Tax=Leptotrombidium pallidum TaxID=279272 RepID=Q4W8E5_9ACAR|nr:NADH dehydrogenase subunit 2 [Leptotrombidium pallidum]BAD99494.1 NADH dehydrogenase subunit 2 [Leptotrombidium pallidum]
MFPITLILFSPFLVLSLESWLLLWMVIELSSVGFILFMKSMEESVIYFLTQTFGSILILYHLVFWKENLLVSFSISSLILSIGLFLKMGLIPLHQWFLNIGSKIKKSPFFVLMTIQKVAPLFLFKLFFKSFSFPFFAIMSVVFGVFFQMSTFNLKELLLYSSIVNMGWMIFLTSFHISSLFLYFFIYTTILLFLIPQMKSDSMTILLGFMSLAGIPPLLGFFMKLIALKTFSCWSEFWSIILLIFSVINVLIYFRVFFPKSLKTPEKIFQIFSNKFEKVFIFSHISFPFFLIFL